MNVSPYYEHAMRRASRDDETLFEKACGHLPKRQESTPYHSSAHSVRSLRTALWLSGSPEDVLEIGFCLGHSASIFFELGADTVTSIESSIRSETAEAKYRVYEKHGGDFNYVFSSAFALLKDEASPLPYTLEKDFGLIFIDGDHGVEAVDWDVRLALKLAIPYILFDDFFEKWSEGVQPAIEKHNLIPIAILGSMALCVPTL